MLQRLFRRENKVADPPIDRDPALDDLQLREARERVRAGDWEAARTVIVAAGTDWSRRGHRIGVLGKAAVEDDGWLRAWTAARPDDPAAAALVASVAAERASKARGSAAASRTSQEQFRNFAELMAEAETAAQRAIALAPQDPTPWIEVLWSLFPNGRNRRDDFAAALAEGKRRDPHNFALHAAALHFYCQKWFGSHEEMYALARGAAADCPPGSAAAMLPVEAHIEYVMREFCWDGHDGLAEARAYFQRPEIQQELDWCVAKWYALGPPQGAVMAARHLQAVAYTLSNRRADLKTVLDDIGPYLGGAYPWSYFFGIPSGFIRVWRWANGV